MSDWPEGWARGDRNPAADDRTQVMGRPPGHEFQGRPTEPHGGGYPPQHYPRRIRPRRPRWGRRILTTIAVLLVLLVVGALFVYITADAKMARVDALPDYEGRPADSPGTNWLLVGSDSRKGLSKKDRRKLATGSAGGKRTDTMMLVHVPEGDHRPTLVSLPRDSLVPVPGLGQNKLNAAYAGKNGPQRLARTVEQVTDIRIDHYMEIGLGGFVEIVDAVGGVEIKVKEDIKDPKAGLDVKKGLQEMDGATALGYVRTRATATSDFGRVERQRQFLAAVLKKVSSSSTVINPFKSVPLAYAAAETLTVDEGTALRHLPSLGFALGGGTLSGTVPVAGTPTLPGVGSVVQWDRARALQLFKALKDDRPVTKAMLQK